MAGVTHREDGTEIFIPNTLWLGNTQYIPGYREPYAGGVGNWQRRWLERITGVVHKVLTVLTETFELFDNFFGSFVDFF